MEQATCVLLLDGGAKVRLGDVEASRLYEELWRLAATVPGALSAAGKLAHARRSSRAEPAGELDERESAAVLRALEGDD